MRILILAVALVLTGCGRAEPAQPRHGAGEVLLRMVYLPGMVGSREYAPLPAFSLYGDGRVIAADPSLAAPGKPGGWHRARQLRIDQANANRLLRLARTALATAGSPEQIPDASAARYQWVDATGRHRTTTVVLPESQDLYQAVSHPESWLHARSTAYRATAIAVLRHDTAQDTTDPRRWPLGTLPTAPCTVLRGDTAARLAAAAASAPQSTPWTDTHHTAPLQLRPLLPDEHSCADL